MRDVPGCAVPIRGTVLQLHPVTRSSASDDVYDQLAASILDGGLEAGAPMPSERALAEALGVSRPVVREALKRLDQAGLVRIRHGGSTIVRDFRRSAGPELLQLLLFDRDGALDLTVARGIVEARSELGPPVAAAAAARATTDELASLRDLVDQLRAADDVAVLQRLAMAFWDVLVDASGNLVYRLLFNALRQAYEPVMDALAAVMRREVSDVDGYATVVAAVAAGDPAAAAAATRAIVDRGAAATIAVIDELLAHPDDPTTEEDAHG